MQGERVTSNVSDSADSRNVWLQCAPFGCGCKRGAAAHLLWIALHACHHPRRHVPVQGVGGNTITESRAGGRVRGTGGLPEKWAGEGGAAASGLRCSEIAVRLHRSLLHANLQGTQHMAT
jgi:hypothetical protein